MGVPKLLEKDSVQKYHNVVGLSYILWVAGDNALSVKFCATKSR